MHRVPRTRRPFPSFPAALLTCLAVASGGVAAEAADDAVKSFVEVDGKGPSPLTSAAGGHPAVRSSDGGIVPTTLDLRIAVGVSQPVSKWLVGAVTGTSPSTLAVVRATQQGVLERLTLRQPVLLHLEITGFGSDAAPVELHAALLSREVKPEGPGPMEATSAPRGVTSGRLVLGGLPVAPIRVVGVGMTADYDLTGLAKSKRTCNDFSIVSPYADAAGLYDWYVQTVPPGARRATGVTRTAELSLPDAAGKLMPLAQIEGVAITGFDTYAEDGALRVKASFSCGAFTLANGAFR